MREVVRWQRRRRGPLVPSWSEEYETLATMLRAYSRRSLALPLRVQRGAAESFLEPSPLLRQTRVERSHVSGVPCAWFRPADADPDAVVMYLHGGGYSIGSVATHSELIARLCHHSRAVGFAIDYRLAPEHRFPCQLEDALAAYRGLLERGYDPQRIALGGESAGGGLTLSTLVAARDGGVPLPRAAFLISPWLDLEGLGASMQRNRRYDYLDGALLRAYAARFVMPHQLREPLAAPLYADLRGLPELLIHVGGAEVLLDDSTRLAERLAGFDVAHELVVYDDMIHAFHVFGAFVEEARGAIDALGQWLRRQLDT